MVESLILYTEDSDRTPNPKKIEIFLKELDLPFTKELVPLADLVKEEYLNLNPNGRVPTLVDPNTGITIWETGAIINYLLENYDKDAKLHYTTIPHRYQTDQWLFFQCSGQGPYYGQKAFFSVYHFEKLPSAIARYTDQIKRVIGVLDLALSRNGTGWLVGDKCTYADLAFAPWNNVAETFLLEKEEIAELKKKYVHYWTWQDTLRNRPSVVDAYGPKAT